MRSADIKVGAEYAVAKGEDNYSKRHPERARIVAVGVKRDYSVPVGRWYSKTSAQDGVEVEWLDKETGKPRPFPDGSVPTDIVRPHAVIREWTAHSRMTADKEALQERIRAQKEADRRAAENQLAYLRSRLVEAGLVKEDAAEFDVQYASVFGRSELDLYRITVPTWLFIKLVMEETRDGIEGGIDE